MSTGFRVALSWLAWPVLLTVCIITTAIGFRLGQHVLAFDLTYLGLAAALFLLEHWLPYEPRWSQSDGQIFADIGHTLVSNGTIQALIVASGLIGLSSVLPAADPPHWSLWPRHWPLVLQVLLGLVASEFALYWAHRLAHTWRALWYFHAVHHSVEKLWIVNSGRFHVVDALKSTVPGLMVLIILGAPMTVLTWLSALTAYIGIFTHCNVEMRFGILSMVFNTPELHRWHHSQVLREGNKNYGENIMLWDWVFGTWFNENRRPSPDIGIEDAMPATLRGQLIWPFRRVLGLGG